MAISILGELFWDEIMFAVYNAVKWLLICQRQGIPQCCPDSKSDTAVLMSKWWARNMVPVAILIFCFMTSKFSCWSPSLWFLYYQGCWSEERVCHPYSSLYTLLCRKSVNITMSIWLRCFHCISRLLVFSLSIVQRIYWLLLHNSLISLLPSLYTVNSTSLCSWLFP